MEDVGSRGVAGAETSGIGASTVLARPLRSLVDHKKALACLANPRSDRCPPGNESRSARRSEVINVSSSV
jgi:hypothetical protein